MSKWVHGFALAVLFACVAVFAYTGNYIALAAPFALLFVALMGLNWKTAWWILLFCIPISTDLSFLEDTISTSLPDEPMMWLFFLLFIVMWARRPDMLPQWWWRNPIAGILVLQLLWLVVAVIFSHVPLLSLKFLIAKSWFLATFFVLPIFIFKDKQDFKKAFLLILVPLVITMIIILYRHYLLDFSFRRIQKAISGIYYNHVDYSTILSMIFPLLFIALALTKNFFFKIPIVLLILFFLPAIFLTYARAALLAIVFAGVVALFIRLKWVNIIMPFFYAFIAIMITFLVYNNNFIKYRPNFEHTYMRKDFTDHIIATFKGEDMSSVERFYRWIAGVRMSMDEPVTGFGPHGFYYNYKPYAVSSFKTYVSRNDEHSTTHNYFLYMLVEQGWPAMILYAILVMVVLAQAQKIYWRFKDRFYKYCTLGVVMIFAACFVNNFFSELLETHKVGALFYLSLALLVVLGKISKDKEAEMELNK